MTRNSRVFAWHGLCSTFLCHFRVSFLPVFDFDLLPTYLCRKLLSTELSTTPETRRMTCPKCGHEQPDVFSQCQKCRFIFPVAQRTRPATSSATGPSLVSVSSGPSIPAFLGALAGATLLAAALWWLWTPAGLAVSEDSYINEKHHFAMAAPAGWVALSPDNYQEMLQQLGHRLPKSLQDGLSNRRIEVGFIKLLEEPNFSPNINVVVMQIEVPKLDEKQLEEGAQALSAEFKKILASYKLEKSELITVDELTCAQFSSRGTLKIKVEDAKGSVNESLPGWPRYTEDAPAQWASFDLKMTQTLVPGKKRAYIITCTSDAKQDRDYKRAFDNAVDSFRVLERPARFGPIVMGGLQGGLIAALAYLLYFIVGSLIAFIRR